MPCHESHTEWTEHTHKAGEPQWRLYPQHDLSTHTHGADGKVDTVKGMRLVR